MGHSIKPEDVRVIAETLIANLDKRGFRYVFVGCRPSQINRGEWTAAFDVFAPDGALIDGPVMVVVDQRTRRARLVEGP